MPLRGESLHDAQQVVEVVRHAAGEPAAGLQFLGVEQLRLHAFAAHHFLLQFGTACE